MRYLVFGDVHGNLPALEKMLEEEKGNYDTLVSHGDVVNYGPWSNECVELLQSIGCICLKGNHEDYFLDGVYPGKNKVAGSFFEYCYPFFQKQTIISTYKQQYLAGDYLVEHNLGTNYIYPDTDVANLGIDKNYIIGHSHYQFKKRIDGFNLFNTGSVGQNREFINIINYLIVDENSEVEMKGLLYDPDTVINEMAHRMYPAICLDYYQQKKRA
jgi:predicted phosphodiesterase